MPETSCSEFVQCNNGQVAQSFSCQPGLIYDKNINQCNWEASATCGEDYVCPTPPPTVSPSGSPTEMPTSYAPTTSPERAGGFKPSLPSGSSSGGFQTSLSYTSTSTNGNELTPIKEPRHAVVWAHLFANKISISNQLLSMAHSMHKVSGSNVESDELRNYAFLDFSNALRSMVEEGYAVPMTDAEGNEQLGRNRFYFGDAESVNGAAIGLINVAAFLSQALAESISNGSCDELNTDSVNGFLPISNACGQHGLSYQDMHCSGEESEMECPLDVYMETRANDNGRVTPFYCGPVDRYDGFTGVADVTRSGEVKQDFPVQNRDGRTDVQGCVVCCMTCFLSPLFDSLRWHRALCADYTFIFVTIFTSHADAAGGAEEQSTREECANMASSTTTSEHELHQKVDHQDTQTLTFALLLK